MYIYQHKEWPHFTGDQAKLTYLLADVRHLQGKLLGRMESLGFSLREEASLQTLTYDVIKTCEIEGETFDVQQVRSSIARRLGIETTRSIPLERDVEGIVEVMLDATRHYDIPLTKERLSDWHAALFQTGRSGLQRIKVGTWRDEASGPMQILSGPIGTEKVHYEAPSFNTLEEEMSLFTSWFNTASNLDGVIKSALAHFWFVSIHPFDDGNGRIARAIADMALAQSEKSNQRFYSMSAQIQKERHTYYDFLEECQKGSLDITLWVDWYLSCLKRAMQASDMLLESILIKARFWEKQANKHFNDRQKGLLNRLLDGFEGKLTSSKWAKICKCSQDTALRDITDLLELHVLQKDENGRNTSYSIKPTTE